MNLMLAAWLKDNIGTIAVGLVLAGILAAVIVSMVRAKKKGKCVGCPYCGKCPSSGCGTVTDAGTKEEQEKREKQEEKEE